MRTAKERVPVRFNLPATTSRKLCERVPSGQRSRFVTQAIERALAEELRAQAIEALEGFPARPVHQDSTQTMRRIRQGMLDEVAGDTLSPGS